MTAVCVCLSSPAPVPAGFRPSRLQARTVVQQCIKAKVRIKPELDGADAQWVEVCSFFFRSFVSVY